jgi:CheY-like chemotaxis protein
MAALESNSPLRARPASHAARRRSRSLLEGVRILLVDDEVRGRALLGRLLGAYGADVRTAGSCAEALAALDRSPPPDVLISDITMPGEDGYTLIRKVRARELGGRTRLLAIALTAHARPQDRERALAAGFQRHIAKPIECAALAALVQDLLGPR